MDIGCYCIDFSRLFAGQEPASAHASAHLHESGVDDLTVGTLYFPSGIAASFTCGMTVHADNTASLCGTEGFIEIPIPWKPPIQRASYIVATGTPPKMDNLPKPAGPSRQTHYVDGGRDLYSFEADDFAAAVQDGAPPRITRQDTLANMRLLDDLRRQVGVRF